MTGGVLVIMILWDVLHTLNVLLVLLFLPHFYIQKTLFFTIITVLTLLNTALLSLFVYRYAYFFLFIAWDIVWNHTEIKRRNYSFDELFARFIVLNNQLRRYKLVTVLWVKTVFIFTVRIARLETRAECANKLMEASSWNWFEAVVIVNLVDRYASVFLETVQEEK